MLVNRKKKRRNRKKERKICQEMGYLSWKKGGSIKGSMSLVFFMVLDNFTIKKDLSTQDSLNWDIFMAMANYNIILALIIWSNWHQLNIGLNISFDLKIVPLKHILGKPTLDNFIKEISQVLVNFGLVQEKR